MDYLRSLHFSTRERIMIIALFSVLRCSTAIGQEPPEEFFRGLDLMGSSMPAAKTEFITALHKDSLFHGTYHFLGVICLNEKKMDSAIYYFRRSIDLNRENVNHTREMAYTRLAAVYLYKLDFASAFNTALGARQLYPDNNSLKLALSDVCLWSFYINHTGLDPSYLSADLKEEYNVRAVDEEYLIIRWIRIDDQGLGVNGQSLTSKKKVYYDILSCSLPESNKSVEVKFRLDWNLSDFIGGNITNVREVYDDKKNPVWERIGALLSSDKKTDLDAEITKLVKEAE